MHTEPQGAHAQGHGSALEFDSLSEMDMCFTKWTMSRRRLRLHVGETLRGRQHRSDSNTSTTAAISSRFTRDSVVLK